MLTFVHFNEGSSLLAASNIWMAKLENIKFLITKYKIDLFGVSEANLGREIEDMIEKLMATVHWELVEIILY